MTRSKTFAACACTLTSTLGMLAGGAAQASAGATPRAHATIIPTQTVQSFYQNPLRRIRSLYAKRIDEGVDYSGAGPIKALGNGVITVLDRGTSFFWAHEFGNVVVVRLQD